MKHRQVFFISDGTGITAETLGTSLLSQFEEVDFNSETIPYVNDLEKAEEVVKRINKLASAGQGRPIIFDTIINHEIRDVIAQSQGVMIEILSTFLVPLEKELEMKSNYTVGKSHSIVNDKAYKVRIDAVHYALDNDDGARTRHYNQADIVLLGVSRCGKTPTCLYLAMQFGIKAANYPLTEDDLDDISLPDCLKSSRGRLFGLTIEPDRLATIRNERKPNSKYASLRQCDLEIRGVEALFVKEGIPYINSTHYSVEEISTRMMEMAGLKRRLHV